MQDRDRAVKEIAGMISAVTPERPPERLRLFEVTHSRTSGLSTVLGTFEAERVLCRDGTLVVERQCETGPISALGRREMTALAIYAPGAWTSVKEIEPAPEFEIPAGLEESFGEFPGAEDNAPLPDLSTEEQTLGDVVERQRESYETVPIVSTGELAGINEDPADLEAQEEPEEDPVEAEDQAP